MTFTQLTNSTGSGGFWDTANENPSINADGTRIAFESDRNLTGDNPDGNMKIFLATLAIGPRVDLTVRGSGSGPDLTNPITVTYSVQGCSGKEMFLVLNAPTMGLPWSYLASTGWVPMPANPAEITPAGELRSVSGV